MSGDEVVKVEKVKIERFMTLGLGRYGAIRAVEEAVDSQGGRGTSGDGLLARRRARNLALTRRQPPPSACWRCRTTSHCVNHPPTSALTSLYPRLVNFWACAASEISEAAAAVVA